jgi:hypothetical protein
MALNQEWLESQPEEVRIKILRQQAAIARSVAHRRDRKLLVHFAAFSSW